MAAEIKLEANVETESIVISRAANPNARLYRRVQNGADVFVEEEDWKWVAFYEDDTQLAQFEDKEGVAGAAGEFHSSLEIDQTKLLALVIQKRDDPSKYFTLHFSKGMRLIYYYRNARLDVNTPYDRMVRLYCFGWAKTTADNKSEKVVMHIYPDDTMHIMDDDGQNEKPPTT